MNIASAQLGFGIEVEHKISLNIYVTGCLNNKNCSVKDCHNFELRSFNIGTYYKEFLFNLDKILNRKDIIDCIVILGGEPLDQEKEELKDLILYLQNKSLLPIYIYTGYSYKDKKEIIDELFNLGIKGFCTGEYNKENNKTWITL